MKKEEPKIKGSVVSITEEEWDDLLEDLKDKIAEDCEYVAVLPNKKEK